MSQMVLRESSNFEETSDDEELSDWGLDDLRFANKLAKSKETVDKRLVDIYMLKKAHEKGVVFGFEND